MSRRALALACVALVAAACGGPPPPPRRQASAAAAAAPKPVTDDEVKPLVPSNIYVYSPIGKRDPFQNTSVLQQGFGRAAQNSGRVKTPLEKWALDQLRLSMTVTGTATPLAMVEDPDHRGWPVRLGDFIGQNGGKVTGIHRDEIVVTETITDHSTGRVYPQNVKLQVPITREEEKDFKALQEGEHMGVAKGDQ
jgi:type IV pilus assembly protein PilP